MWFGYQPGKGRKLVPGKGSKQHFAVDARSIHLQVLSRTSDCIWSKEMDADENKIIQKTTVFQFLKGYTEYNLCFCSLLWLFWGRIWVEPRPSIGSGEIVRVFIIHSVGLEKIREEWQNSYFKVKEKEARPHICSTSSSLHFQWCPTLSARGISDLSV